MLKRPGGQRILDAGVKVGSEPIRALMLQQQALREQHKLLREKERRSASCGGRGSQSSPGSHSGPAHAYESPGSLAATSSSSELARHAARTPNTATLSSPTDSPRHECISDD